MKKKTLTKRALLKVGWMEAVLKSKERVWLWRHEDGSLTKHTFEQAQQVTRKAFPGVYL